MKKMKKMLAMLLTLAMVMGMAVTVFADQEEMPKSTITVSGLVSEETQQVTLYQAVSYDLTIRKWVVADWAESYVTQNGATGDITAIDWNGMYQAVAAATAYTQEGLTNPATVAAGSTTCNFDGTELPIGAYMIKAETTSEGSQTVYSVMGVSTYDNTATGIAAKAGTVIAKSEKTTTNKSADKYFVKRGDEVSFTIKTVFPYFDLTDEKYTGAESITPSYTIKDTPVGLEDFKDLTIKIGNMTVVDNETYPAADADGNYVFDLSEYITDDNYGKAVVITYKATVADAEGYTNEAHSFKDDQNIDVTLGTDPEDPDGPNKVTGYTASIDLTKHVQGDEADILNGAEFKVYEGTKASHGEAMKFVAVAGKIGEYKLAKEGETGADEIVIATNGTVKISGLTAGTYWFEETKAPAGYSINENGKEVTVTVDDIAKVVMKATYDKDGNVITETVKTHLSASAKLGDTKLSALPSTGGMGTMIFTIGGCLIMIIAAGLFFASRRKSAK